MSQPSARACFVLIHGAWHSAACWRPIIDGLQSAGHFACAIDLPGSGSRALLPLGYSPRTSDFPSSPSLNTHHTQQQRTDAVLEQVRVARAHGPVIVVGHSMGTLTATSVAAAAAEQVAAVVYIAGQVMAAPLRSLDTASHPKLAVASAGWGIGNPMELGASRVDWQSSDAAYRQLLHATFAGDVDEATFARHAATLYPDEGIEPFTQPSPATPDSCGRVPRYHVRLGDDRAMSPGGQDWLREEMDKAMGNSSTEYRLQGGHLVMLSRPAELVQVLLDIAKDVEQKARDQIE